VGRSLYKSESWRESLASAALESGQSVARVESETDMSDLAEGVYIKVEEDGVVKERYKWVRAGFLSAILEASGETSTHWLEREHVWNKLREGADLYAWGWRA